MFNFDDDNYNIMEESRETIEKINLSKYNTKKDIINQMTESFTNYDFGRDLFETFNITDFEKKSKVDLMYYDQLLQKIEDSVQLESIQKILINISKSVKDVYEISNLKPEIYGKSIDENIFELSNQVSREKLSKVIYEFLDNNFYKLSNEKRVEKYLDESKELSKKLIIEGVNSDDAISYSVKTVVMENLLTKIAFPFSVWSRINRLMECNIYTKVFDQERLIESVDNFKKNVKSAARIIGALV